MRIILLILSLAISITAQSQLSKQCNAPYNAFTNSVKLLANGSQIARPCPNNKGFALTDGTVVTTDFTPFFSSIRTLDSASANPIYNNLFALTTTNTSATGQYVNILSETNIADAPFTVSGIQSNLTVTGHTTNILDGMTTALTFNNTSGIFGQISGHNIFTTGIAANQVQSVFGLQIRLAQISGTVGDLRAALFLKNGNYTGSTMTFPDRDYAILSRVNRPSDFAGGLVLNNNNPYSGTVSNVPLTIRLAVGQTANAVNLVNSSDANIFNVNANGQIKVSGGTPASAAAACDTGTILWDTSFLYVCIATNTWKRSAISTW